MSLSRWRVGFTAYYSGVKRTSSARTCQCLGCGRRRPARISVAWGSETPKTVAMAAYLSSVRRGGIWLLIGGALAGPGGVSAYFCRPISRSISLSNSDGFIPKLPAKSNRAFKEGLFSPRSSCPT